ncbi:glucokinase [Parabacteroides sp. PF5-5]|uniref:ROK family protein n=1 Tax=unclassified Parabacteroides TaxID=2649774 RepID=UPI0024745CE6|nr:MULTISPECIES: ROK family protein [unclassified Parabacteroides]MDH6304451.1 glucokinase [Parabacteroides sp. PH5-39]MDH6315396.1 glucokinase [Parabacteroides sp. PF5-13]MDH6319110.1 glucokinase [Parabacteroides sp. PH5-13]MDH6322840.1 glucokinase [Parabacteroides sp. PH5-8]MDH6326588.1 glucokinase [Parabacteroides sp. PH5-41]
MKLGIDLGGTNIRIGKLHDGKIIEKISAPSPSKMQLEESITYLKSVISPMISSEVTGIGIGVPSVVDVSKGIVYNVTNIPAWEEVHLRQILEDEFHIPIFINNDANCFAIGENRYGEGKGYPNMIGVTLGTGVGAGVVIDNVLYNGSNVGAGEIGCMRYLDHVYEHYCGSEFFTTYHNTSGKEAAERARNNDPEALKIWEEYGKHLGELVQVILYAYDPDAIVFGGGIADAFPLFSESLKASLQTFLFPKSLEKLQIKISKNPDIALLGALALVQ